jgi:anti-sigma regulatory factor (Ser/Thr protein kinase)
VRLVATDALILPGQPADVGAARAFVRNFLDLNAVNCERDAAVTVISELVTNAVLHGVGPVHVTVSLAADELRLAVEDASGAIPQPREPELAGQTERRIAVVHGLTSAWGVESTARGKRVWASLAVDGGAE